MRRLVRGDLIDVVVLVSLKEWEFPLWADLALVALKLLASSKRNGSC